MSYHFILGADDPEMRQIEHILRKHGLSYEYALSGPRTIPIEVPDAPRVSPSNSYEAYPQVRNNFSTYVFVECCFQGGRTKGSVEIDHHRPGDPGYDLGPDKFWEASSIGQLCALLEIEPDQRDLEIAAMDHCFSDALKGKCPGVERDAVLQLKKEEIAKGTGTSIVDVEVGIELFRHVFRNGLSAKIETPRAFRVEVIEESWGDKGVFERVRFMRLGTILGTGYSLSYLCASVAAVLERKVVELCIRDVENGPIRHHVTGEVPPHFVEWYTEKWAVRREYENIYGVPSRGYAGGTEAA